eukprot:SAG31_NODE_2083_length_6490_cov_21.969645_2_plen_197_part_00
MFFFIAANDKDPAWSIPYGTIAAISTAFFFYICLIVGQAGTMDQTALHYNMNVLQDQTWEGKYVVVLGVATACLSTSLGSMFGSARILQAIARDKLIPGPDILNRIFSAGTKKGDEPRHAVCLTYLIAGAGVFYGGLDKVAPILTNFFLLTYSLTNLATVRAHHQGAHIDDVISISFRIFGKWLYNRQHLIPCATV